MYTCAVCFRNPARLVDLGHDGPPQGWWPDNLLTGVELTRCPIRQLQLADVPLRQEIERWRDEYYPLYRKGHLLVDGGVADQPARYLEAMRYLERMDGLIERKYVEIKYPKDKTAP